MENYKQPGWIEVITGPMFAGKSEELIRRLRRLDYAHQKYLVFKPAIDNRYSVDNVESHLHNKAKCIPVKNTAEIRAHLTEPFDVLAIDEVSFLDFDVVALCDELANKGKRVIVAGLDTDFRGEPFPITAALLCKAEFVTKLTAICVKCGEPATMSQRLINGAPAPADSPIVLIGASEAYEPRCRHCHVVPKKN